MHSVPFIGRFFAVSLGLAIVATTPAVAQNCARWSEDLPDKGFVAEYVTDITVNDLTNSRGTHLTDFRQILQQDRFNAHERGEVDGMVHDDGVFDPFDLDVYFTNPTRRQQLATADYSLTCPGDLNDLRPQIEAGRLQGFLYVRAYPIPGGGLRVFLALVG